MTAFWPVHTWPVNVFSTPGDNLRQQVFAAVKAGVETVLTTNGYATNIGAHVFEWKAEPWDPENDVPGVDLRDEDAGEILTVGEELHRLKVHCRCAFEGNATSSEVRKVIADLTTLIGLDPSWGGLAQDTGRVSADLAEIDQGEHTAMGVDAVFEVEYLALINNAYA